MKTDEKAWDVSLDFDSTRISTKATQVIGISCIKKVVGKLEYQ